MREQVEQALEAYVRPALREHCGEVKVTRIEGGTVYVRMLGQCAGCASLYYTLDGLVEDALKAHVPGVERVELDTFDMDFYQYARSLLRNTSGKGPSA